MGEAIDLAVTEQGHGPAVLLIHGMAGTAEAHFAPLVAQLAAAGFRCILPDLRGHGASRHLAAHRGRGLFHAHAADLAALIAQRNLAPVHLIGYSDGGEIAAILAARLGAGAASLAVWGASGQIPPPAIVALYADPAAHIADEPAFRAELERLHGRGGSQLLAVWAEAMAEFAATGGAIDPAAAAALACPTLVLSGDRDPFNPLEAVITWARQIPAARLRLLPNCGHDLLAEQPELLAAELLAHLRSAATWPTPRPHLERRGSSSGTPILLLHGWGASVALFEPHMQRLAEFPLLALDFPGFGATAAPPAAWSVHDYAAWVRALLAREGWGRVVIVGHSFGGRVALSLAAHSPELVEKLVLTGSAGILPRRSLAYHARVRLFKLARQLAEAPFSPPPLRAFAQRYVAARGSSDYRNAAGTLRASFVRVVNEDLRPLLPKISAPTLLVWGERDEDTPLADGQLMERLIPDAGLVVFEGAGHYAYLEQAERFCTIVETFLRAP